MTNLTAKAAQAYVEGMEREWGLTPATVSASMGGYSSYANELPVAASYDADLATVFTQNGNVWTVWIEDGEIYGEC